MIPSVRAWVGLVLGERSLAAAEILASGARCEIRRAAVFDYPEGLSLREPERLGVELRAFLRRSRFSARRAVLGLPARWLIVRPRSVPPVSAESAAGLLRIQGEREFSLEPAELVLDWAGETSPAEARSVLLVATPRERLDQAVALARNAGLRVRSVTSTALALSGAGVLDGEENGPVLWLDAEAAELVLRDRGGLRAAAHVGDAPGSPEDAGRLAEAVRRVLLLAPGVEAGGRPATLAVCDAAGPRPDVLARLAERLPLRVAEAKGFAAVGQGRARSAEDAGQRAVAAAALAMAGSRKALPVDFLHSRLQVSAPGNRRRRMGWAAALGATFLAAGLLLVYDWQREASAIASANSHLAALKPDYDAAKRFVDRISFTEAWFDKRPPVLDCLRDLTLAFPSEGKIWATSLALRGDMRGIVSGEAVDQKAVLEVVDALKASRSFTEAKPLYMRTSAGRRSEVSFAISFAYTRAEPKRGSVQTR